MSRARVVLADGEPVTRAALRLALPAAEFEVVAEAGDADAAVRAVAAAAPDLAVVGADLLGGGVAAVRAIVGTAHGVRVVVLSARPDEDEFVAAVTGGAVGYLGKDVDPGRLGIVLRGVLAGEAALPRRFGARLLDELRARDHRRARLSGRASAPLTDREWEVLQLIATGSATSEVARRTGVAPVTVRRHVSSAVAKLGVPDRAAAVALVRDRSRD